MANKTVALNSQLYSGTSGLTLLLINPSSGAIGNGSGDTLTAGSNGLFTATVTEAITGWWNVVVRNGSTPILEGGKVYFAGDAEGTYVVDDPQELSASVSVLPGYITQQKAAQLNELIVPLLSQAQQSLTCYNTDGTAQDLSGKTLQFVVSMEDETAETGQTVIDTIANSGITVSGASSNIATFRYTADMVALPRRLIWSLRDVTSTNNVELQGGTLNVRVSASTVG